STGPDSDGGQPPADASIAQPDASVGDLGGGAPPDLATPPDLAWTPADVAKYVNPLIGTQGGETWPGVDTPLGMGQWSPAQTGGHRAVRARRGGYSWGVTKFGGFSLTHMSGTGCAGAYGDIPFFPYPGTVASPPSSDSTDAKYASTFSHANETAEAGRYHVRL